MAFRVERAAACSRDLEAIFDFLFQAALDFGEPAETGFARAAARIGAIEDALEALGRAPFQGSLRPDLGEGLRSVTKDRAVFYFELDEPAKVLRVLAVFFGGQDHQRRMLIRLLSQDRDNGADA